MILPMFTGENQVNKSIKQMKENYKLKVSPDGFYKAIEFYRPFNNFSFLKENIKQIYPLDLSNFL